MSLPSETTQQGLKKEYSSMVYDRDYILNSDVKDTIADVTGLSRSDVDKIVFDGKVIPVIVLNKYYFKGAFINANCGTGTELVPSTPYLNKGFTLNGNDLLIPAKGLYQFIVQCTTSKSVAGTCWSGFYGNVNGAAFTGNYQGIIYVTNSTAAFGVSALEYLNKGDVVDFWSWNTANCDYTLIVQVLKVG